MFSERISTWFSEVFAMSVYDRLLVVPTRRSFSRILSNTTTVSYRENPRIVKNAMTVAGVTSKPVMAYTPTVIKMSWITAMIAAVAILMVNRSDR